MSLTSILRMLFASALFILLAEPDVLAQSVPNSSGNKVCNPMANQRLSTLRDRCVILDKEGLKLTRVTDMAGFAPIAFVIEDQPTEAEMNSPNYVNRAEIFISVGNSIQSIVLTRTDNLDYASWVNGPYLLYMDSDENDNTIYRLEKTVNGESILIYEQKIAQ